MKILYNEFVLYIYSVKDFNGQEHGQQQKGQLENYILSMPITYSKDEVDNILSSQSNNSQPTLNNVTFKWLLEELKKRFKK